jgi:hypothetical protein
MNANSLSCVVIGTILPLSIIYTIPFIWAQSYEIDITNKLDNGITYIQQARQLLNQSKFEYARGNTTGAEELAIRAYLDNFEYVELPLEQKGQQQLKQTIESMMRNELRTLIKEETTVQEFSKHINSTDANLVEAIHVLNNTN